MTRLEAFAASLTREMDSARSRSRWEDKDAAARAVAERRVREFYEEGRQAELATEGECNYLDEPDAPCLEKPRAS